MLQLDLPAELLLLTEADHQEVELSAALLVRYKFTHLEADPTFEDKKEIPVKLLTPVYSKYYIPLAQRTPPSASYNHSHMNSLKNTRLIVSLT